MKIIFFQKTVDNGIQSRKLYSGNGGYDIGSIKLILEKSPNKDLVSVGAVSAKVCHEPTTTTASTTTISTTQTTTTRKKHNKTIKDNQ